MAKMITVTVTPEMAAIMRQALYVAHAHGSMREDHYRDALMILKGIHRDPHCPGRAFHESPQHFCGE